VRLGTINGSTFLKEQRSWQPIDVPNKDIPLIVAWKPHMATWPAAQSVTVKPTASLIGAPAESKASSAALSVIQTKIAPINNQCLVYSL